MSSKTILLERFGFNIYNFLIYYSRPVLQKSRMDKVVFKNKQALK